MQRYFCIYSSEFNNEEPIKAIQNVVKRIRDYYAVAVLDASTERIYVFTVGNPLVIRCRSK